MYNEPDLPMFFSGTWDEYLQMYKYGVLGIKEGDPDAVVGGPASAFIGEHLDEFLDFVTSEDLPLDFFSFHSYGTIYPWQIQAVREKLASRPRFSTTEMHLNEFNILPVDSSPGGPVDKYALASGIFKAIKLLLEETDLTLVHWAQFMDAHPLIPGLGTVDLNGRRKASFNAFKIYAMMPVDRCLLSNNGIVDAMASTDGHKASVVLWNDTETTQTGDVNLNNIPFSRGNFRVYRIDADHASYGDNPANELLLPVEEYLGIDTGELSWSGEVPPEGVVYLEVEDGTGISELNHVSVAKVIRKHHYYPERGKSNYAEFDENTWIAYLGMGNERFAHSLVGVTAEEFPPSLSVSFIVDGPLHHLDKNSLLGIRIDYEVGGEFTKGVLFHGGLYDSERDAPMPWGTKRLPDEVIQVRDLSNFKIAPATNAPANWSGRAIISFEMQNTGANTRAKVIISESTVPNITCWQFY